MLWVVADCHDVTSILIVSDITMVAEADQSSRVWCPTLDILAGSAGGCSSDTSSGVGDFAAPDT